MTYNVKKICDTIRVMQDSKNLRKLFLGIAGLGLAFITLGPVGFMIGSLMLAIIWKLSKENK